MRAGEVVRVLGRLEERDCAARVVECANRVAVDLGEPGRSPVEADSRIGVCAVLALAERFAQDLLGAREVALIRQRRAEVAREANVTGDVPRVVAVELVEAVLEQLDRALVGADQRVRAGQRCEGVGAVDRRDACVDRALEVLGGLGVPVQLRGDLAEADLGADRRRVVAGVVRLARERGERFLRGFGLAADPQLELGVGEAQLAFVDVAQLRARLEVLGRDAERARERAERLHGRTPRAGLDPRDVGVRDAGTGQFALRQPTLEAKTPESDPDWLWLTSRHEPAGSCRSLRTASIDKELTTKGHLVP